MPADPAQRLAFSRDRMKIAPAQPGDFKIGA
jgi:hypothetical protein